MNKDVRRSTRWLSPWVQSRVRAYPYFIFHYTFNKVILSNPELRMLYEQAPVLEAGPSHRLQALAKEPEGLAQALDLINHGRSLMQKLNWRIDLSAPYWNAVMKHLNEYVTEFPASVRQ